MGEKIEAIGYQRNIEEHLMAISTNSESICDPQDGTVAVEEEIQNRYDSNLA